MGILRLAVGIMGNVATLSLYSAPIITFRRVVRKKTTEEFSCIPYIITLLECLVYTWYATPVVSYGWENLPVVTIDVIGTILEASFIIIYLWFAPVKEKVKVAALTILTVLSFVLIVTLSTFAYHDHHHRKLFVGCIGVVTATVMYGSPLVAMITVIKTKSVEFMPFYLSFCTFLSSVLWTIFGLMNLDFFIATPNIIGCVLGILQLALYFKYMKRSIQEEEPNKWDIEKNEEKKIKVEFQPEVKETIIGKN
ncbi:hypothetical protein K2173_008538 [Erythroxylum novogranatense]|uniref:Bidirectional sugar transporter SWEET n=1 Tax=Erythroxylum novogranatense TaxID=1862640 RepID=A0AAV8SKS5_9ROSI|nr:hypothetical protein K2173_008538 [Erythroxylum novogranatense]